MASGGEIPASNINVEKDADEPLIPHKDLPQPGYEHVFVDKVHPEDFCGICKFVVRDPVQVLRCGHAFCRSCLDCWFSYCEQREDATLRCPSDNDVIARDDIIEDKKSRRIIRNLRVYCDNSVYGCTATPELSDLERHMSTCMYQMVNCPLSCDHQVLKWSLDTHVVQECLRRIEPCRMCMEDMEVGIMAEHSDVCPMKEVTCDYCNEVQIFRKDLIAHHGVCDEFPVSCSYKQFGCESEMRRREMSEHEALFVQRHMALMMKSVTCLQNDLTTTTNDLTTTMNDLTKTKDQLTTTTNDLTTTMNELTTTKDDLTTTMNELTTTKDQLTTTKDELNTTKDELAKAMDELNAKCAENRKLTEDLKEQHEKSVDKIDKSVEKNKQELEGKITELSEDINRYNTLPFYWRVEMERNMEMKESGRFYTKKNGYKIYLKACMLTKGENDKDLRWPMEGNISLSVRDATSGKLLGSTSKIDPSRRQRPETDRVDHQLLFTNFRPPSSPLKVEVCVE